MTAPPVPATPVRLAEELSNVRAPARIMGVGRIPLASPCSGGAWTPCALASAARPSRRSPGWNGRSGPGLGPSGGAGPPGRGVATPLGRASPEPARHRD